MTREEAAAKAAELVAKMTLEEKASQLRFDAPEIARLGIPAYNWWNEALHGVARAGTATVFPQAIGLAAAFDQELMEEVGDVIAREGRAKYNAARTHGDRNIYKGLTFWSPNVNIFRDPRWGRGHETYGEDPTLTASLAVPFIRGIQGDGPVMKAAACAKHFAVHSGPEAMRHRFNAEATPKDMEETYLPAFEASVKEGKVEAVMGAYNRTNGEPCCGSPTLITDILRDKWGFEGHYVSDCWAISDFHNFHGVTSTPEESAALALKAGCDVNCGITYQYVLSALSQGLISEDLITKACVRLFTTRYLLGMFGETPYDDIPITEAGCAANQAVADRASAESLVLLKNDGTLPLRKDLKTIAVVGPNADSRRALIGNYHGTAAGYRTVLEGIMSAVSPDTRVLYSEGSDLKSANMEGLSGFCRPDLPGDRLAEALAVSEAADAVILVVGLDETLEGEEGDQGNAYFSGDKEDLLLPEGQRVLMSTLLAQDKPVIVVSMTGSSIDLSEAEEKAAAVLQAWYPGGKGGDAVASVLFGDVSPSGKLPVTFYRSVEDLPEFTDYSMKGRTYRYFTGSPLYPFGYGLTYGKTGVETLTVSDDGSSVCVKVKNCGNTDTEDVLQLYVKDEDSAFAAPNPCLAAFTRIRLAAGEEKTVNLTLPERAFTTVDEEGVRAVRGHRFSLYAGFNGPDERARDLSGAASVRAELLR